MLEAFFVPVLLTRIFVVMIRNLRKYWVHYDTDYYLIFSDMKKLWPLSLLKCFNCSFTQLHTSRIIERMIVATTVETPKNFAKECSSSYWMACSQIDIRQVTFCKALNWKCRHESIGRSLHVTFLWRFTFVFAKKPYARDVIKWKMKNIISDKDQWQHEKLMTLSVIRIVYAEIVVISNKRLLLISFSSSF